MSGLAVELELGHLAPSTVPRGQPVLSAMGLTVRHGSAEVLRDVSLEIRAGSIVTLIGPNGAGKSTLIRALIGLQPLAAGRIERRPSLRIGYVPQRLAVERGLPLTVRRFLTLTRRASKAELDAALALVGAQQVPLGQGVQSLSPGQWQRVQLARALLTAPELLVLDEPAQGVDQAGLARLYTLLGSLRDRLGCAVLLVSHDLHVVMAQSDHVVCLNGHVCCAGAPSQVTSSPAYREMFGLDPLPEPAFALYGHGCHGCSHDSDALPASQAAIP